MSFRENLQHMRAAHNMTQEQLAMLLGVSRQSVTKWESEKSYPEMDKLLRMCQIFDCTLDELVQGDLTGRPVEPAASVASASWIWTDCGPATRIPPRFLIRSLTWARRNRSRPSSASIRSRSSPR